MGDYTKTRAICRCHDLHTFTELVFFNYPLPFCDDKEAINEAFGQVELAAFLQMLLECL